MCLQAPLERSVTLPERINPRTARALLTVHGLLLVTAEAEETTPPEGAPAGAAPAAAEQPAAAAADGAPAPAADGQAAAALEARLTLEESPVEGLA